MTGWFFRQLDVGSGFCVRRVARVEETVNAFLRVRHVARLLSAGFGYLRQEDHAAVYIGMNVPRR